MPVRILALPSKMSVTGSSGGCWPASGPAARKANKEVKQERVRFMNDTKKSVGQVLKFTLFSISAGLIQIGSFAVLEIFIKDFWIPYVISLVLSILWNFTLNRKYTFRSATNVPVAMAKVFGFYLVFTPLSTWLGDLAEGRGVNDFLILALTMLANFVLEFVFCKFVVYRGKEDTI